MKKLVTAIAIFAAVSSATAQIKMPAPSPTQTIKQDFALGTVELTYSRPSAKGRKIFGDLVPFNKVWRTGANTATVIKFTDPVEIGGKRIDTGTYALYTVPGAASWEFILNKGVKNWGSTGYTDSADVLRIKVPSMKMANKAETFTMQFANIKPESCELHIMWENTAVAVPISALIKDRIRTQVEKAMMGEKKPNYSAAQFYYEYDKDNVKALSAASAAVVDNPKAYWIWIYKAKIEKEMGDKKAAMASSQKSMMLATEEKNDDYVKMNQDFQKTLK
jgi:Protein of unknown function (DUF2911)